MRFFVPSANSVPDGEHVYQGIRERLVQSVGGVSERRIHSIRFHDQGRVLTLAVGDSFRRLGGEPVIAILEAEASYFVCTAHHGGNDGEPFRIDRKEALQVQDFTALA